MGLSSHRGIDFQASLEAGRAVSERRHLTLEQGYIARCMGVEELELLRAAASTGGIQLASLSWIVASLAKHGFLEISPSSGRRLRAVATHAGHLVLVMRPDIEIGRASCRERVCIWVLGV